jgi:hypothetical protein
MADMVTEGAHCPRLGVPCSMGTLLCIGELTEVIHEVRRHLDSIRAEIAALPDDQQREATAAILSATQSLGDLYSEFAADMLRILCSRGSA